MCHACQCLLWASHPQGTLRGSLTIAACVIVACGSVADGGGWARVEQAAQGGCGAQLAAQQEPLALPRLRREKQECGACEEGG